MCILCDCSVIFELISMFLFWIKRYLDSGPVGVKLGDQSSVIEFHSLSIDLLQYNSAHRCNLNLKFGTLYKMLPENQRVVYLLRNIKVKKVKVGLNYVVEIG